MTPIPLRDAPARAGDRCWFVAGNGRRIIAFILLREDYFDQPCRMPERLIVAEVVGVYDPGHCFVSQEKAEAFAARILMDALESASQTVAELSPVRLTAAERVEVESCGR